jgi:hypothetical protein
MACKEYVLRHQHKSQLDLVVILWDINVVRYMSYLSNGKSYGAHAAAILITKPRKSRKEIEEAKKSLSITTTRK